MPNRDICTLELGDALLADMKRVTQMLEPYKYNLGQKVLLQTDIGNPFTKEQHAVIKSRYYTNGHPVYDLVLFYHPRTSYHQMCETKIREEI